MNKLAPTASTVISIFLFLYTTIVFGNSLPKSKIQSQTPVCSENRSPYRDLDFLVGRWDFFTMDGKKIAAQVYSKKEQGCLIHEDWSTLFGGTGTGMNFVDPATGKWRQVWMSPRYHIDYSGGLVENGDFVLEGRIYPNNGEPVSAIRGVYSRQADGSVVKEFLTFDESTKIWKRFFIGVARRNLEKEE
ncbi:hypothetical protein [uncultured Microbulbifer sp.]|uniref:hypothetical protein n=1 Tax=uncultured Microbulbifer sp. TaxID=348147 RepID=UPI002616BCB0|nr:hypothetical protein [uncultured Microbulbifer sp.]